MNGKIGLPVAIKIECAKRNRPVTGSLKIPVLTLDPSVHRQARPRHVERNDFQFPQFSPSRDCRLDVAAAANGSRLFGAVLV